jgi:hypothetical protein
LEVALTTAHQALGALLLALASLLAIWTRRQGFTTEVTERHGVIQEQKLPRMNTD